MTNLTLVEKGQNKSGDLFSKFRFYMKFFLIPKLMLLSKIAMSQIMLPAYQGVVSKIPAVVTPSFSCGPSTVSDIDGNIYDTVSIGTQCWTVTNLRVRRYNDSTEIRFNNSGGSGGTTSQTWSVLNYGAHTIYANDSVASPSNLTTYGYLYNWYAAKGIANAGSTTYKNICPTDWHVPTDGEWTSLIQFIVPTETISATVIGSQSLTAGGKLKSTSTTLWQTPGFPGTDNYGFSALPGGGRNDVGSFSSIRDNAFFWSATEDGSNDAWRRSLSNANSNVSRRDYSKTSGFSVRCLRD
jgi:uncharacterized protein (TIGR02145 family)